MERGSIKSLTFISLCVAIMAIISQLSVPIGAVPITLQALSVAFIGYFLGVKKGLVAILVYILLGAVGAPVFAGFQGGFHMLIGYTGGFIFGFVPFTCLCGIGSKKWVKIALGMLGLLLCHIIGIIQYSILAGLKLWISFLSVSLPYLLKDIMLTASAYFIAEKVKQIKRC